MLLLRIFGALLLNTLGETLVGYVFDQGSRQWLRFTARALLVVFVIALIFMALYAIERLVVTVWQGRLATAEALQGRFER
jgi:hypothetical protein